ncbi:hypothetical protein NDU88_002258 [Pleurodeles waltl]|uniref:Uncharacterized protein n=1 Tax=Pleurodeles waltl TaxID=8319 RepID=A0AAV7VCC3_PLEWA|nr:hypothetical protein NDU88_002258 [Pleurodeles waltl]
MPPTHQVPSHMTTEDHFKLAHPLRAIARTGRQRDTSRGPSHTRFYPDKEKDMPQKDEQQMRLCLCPDWHSKKECQTVKPNNTNVEKAKADIISHILKLKLEQSLPPLDEQKAGAP